jgi:alkylation response protein AidB-like acyl-CoA dehydrogenase
MTTLNHERSPADIGYTARYARAVRSLEARTREHGTCSPSARRALALAFVNAEVLRMHVKRRLSERLSGGDPGAEGAVDKLLMTATEQLVGEASRALGTAAAVGDDEPTWLNVYLYGRAGTVMGGTSQIQRNVVASQLLGLRNS